LPFLQEKADEITSVSGDNLRRRFSLSFAFCSNSSIDNAISQLAAACLSEGCWIQYSTCSRHPYEFLMKLKRAWANENQKTDWKQIASKVIVVDGYTRNFGFTDSVHEMHARLIEKEGTQYIAADESFAGLHTAAAKAFNYIKDQMKGLNKDLRQPALVIYEGSYSLVDLESVEQYRIFMHHLFPSERLWGAMLTVVLEYGVPDTIKPLLSSGADIFCEMNK
jgi:hypothetical protein